MIDKRKRRVSSGRNSKALRPEEREGVIERNILFYFIRKDIFAWKVKSMGTFDPAIKRFRSTPKHYRKGVPDIHGFYRGVPFVIEVKSKNGKLSPDQETFKRDYLKNARAGWFIVARSVEEVQEAFALIDRELNGTGPSPL